MGSLIAAILIEMPSAMWKCPKCGHRFASRNLWHSCGRYRIADHFRGKDPAVRRTYRRFAEVVRSCGKVTIYAQKSRIVCMVDVRFAGAVARKKWLECGMWLDRKAAHPALVRIERFSAGSYGHYFRFRDPSEIDEAFASLLREAYGSHSRARNHSRA
jgi:hypothetical protein